MPNFVGLSWEAILYKNRRLHFVVASSSMEENRQLPKLFPFIKHRDVPIHFNPLYTGGLFHCYMLEESICHFRAVGSILLL